MASRIVADEATGTVALSEQFRTLFTVFCRFLTFLAANLPSLFADNVPFSKPTLDGTPNLAPQTGFRTPDGEWSRADQPCPGAASPNAAGFAQMLETLVDVDGNTGEPGEAKKKDFLMVLWTQQKVPPNSARSPQDPRRPSMLGAPRQCCRGAGTMLTLAGFAAFTLVSGDGVSSVIRSPVPSEGAYEYQEPGEADDPQRVSEYVFDIFSKLDRDEEKFALPRPDYMKDQPELCEEERSIAIDWLVEVQGKYKLRTETLFLAVGLFDRFLSTKKVRRDDLQLIVVCASFIAAKFEEIDPPEVRDFVHMTQQACSKQSIVAMEVKMLTALEFCLCRPTAAHFLERYHRANGCSEVQRFILQYALELALLDLKMAKYSPSQQVAAALIISTGLAQELPVWPSGITDETRCESMCGPSPVVDCAREMCRLIQVIAVCSLGFARFVCCTAPFALVGLGFGGFGFGPRPSALGPRPSALGPRPPSAASSAGRRKEPLPGGPQKVSEAATGEYGFGFGRFGMTGMFKNMARISFGGGSSSDVRREARGERFSVPLYSVKGASVNISSSFLFSEYRPSVLKKGSSRGDCGLHSDSLRTRAEPATLPWGLWEERMLCTLPPEVAGAAAAGANLSARVTSRHPRGDKAGVFAMAPAFPQEPVDRALSLHPIRVPPVPLTGEMLRRLGEASRAGDVVPGSSAVEVLHWKRLVEQKERQFMKKENDEERGGKITQGLYSASDARHQFQSAARARQALIRESQGTFSLGAQVLE
ncbi:unnamed protein product [Polarella glacialis]|uniref:G2/mitotic-specific cyclin-B3 n=1 Tax=Polarella glacialis TaxID=89957 RepID=A0A813DAG3_POLGL|nr:unnamed protein product [Polarella glacialis]